MFILLILNYLDRNALASARVQGLEKDLGLKGDQFNIAVSILFAGYILGQIPSNLILSRVRPSIYLSAWVALWGIVSACTAAADNYNHLLVIRFFLGVTESPYFPGALFLLSSWYTKKELAFRTSIVSVAKPSKCKDYEANTKLFHSFIPDLFYLVLSQASSAQVSKRDLTVSAVCPRGVGCSSWRAP